MNRDANVDSIILSEDEKLDLAKKGFLVVCDERNNRQEDEYQTNVSLLVHPMSPLHPEFRIHLQDFLSELCETIDDKFVPDSDSPEERIRMMTLP